MVARTGAIEAYSMIEQSLCLLFSHLLGTPQEKAAIVFFRITNTHSRNHIIERLLEKAHRNQFNAYWDGTKEERGLWTLIRQLDARRNEIVHWHNVRNINFEGDKVTTSETLTPPNLWDKGPDSPNITVTDLTDFIAKGDFVKRSINMFSMTIYFPNIPDAERQPWLKIFAQPVTYPPPDTHPLSPNYKAPETQPQSSGTS